MSIRFRQRKTFGAWVVDVGAMCDRSCLVQLFEARHRNRDGLPRRPGREPWKTILLVLVFCVIVFLFAYALQKNPQLNPDRVVHFAFPFIETNHRLPIVGIPATGWLF